MHNSQKLSLTNIYVLHSNFVRCESFFESNSPDILALDEIHLDSSFESSNSSVRSHLSLIRKGSVILIHGLAVYLKDVLSFAQICLLKDFWFWCHDVVAITTSQPHSRKPELRFCTGSNPAHGMLEIRDGEDLW